MTPRFKVTFIGAGSVICDVGRCDYAMRFSASITIALALMAGSSILLLGCTRGVVGGNPTLAAASTNGTSRIFEGTEAEIGAAITNAFDGVGYHDMLFVPIDPTVPFTVPPGKVV